MTYAKWCLAIAPLMMLSALGLGGCGGSNDDEGDAAGAGASGSGRGGTAGSDTTSGDSGASTSGGSGAPTSGGSGAGGGASSADIEACSGEKVEFAEVSAAEYVQWSVDGKPLTATPPAGGAYFFNGFLNLTTYTASFSGSVSIGVAVQRETFEAGTYRCHEGEATGMVSVNGLGVANQTATGADCAVTYDEEVEDGGRLKGTFWAYFPAVEWPLKSPGGCVHGRFDVTDAVDPEP